MNRFLGEVKPVYGRWVWPFKHMEDGDWFLVSWEHRDPEALRNLVSVRAAQLGMKFAVEKRPIEHPGFTKVTRGGEIGLRPREQVDFETMAGIIQRYYATDPSTLKWTILEEGEVEERMAQREGEPSQLVFITVIPDRWKFAVELLPDRIRMERIEMHDTLERWRKRQMASVMD